MNFVIRPARSSDIEDLLRLATSLSARGFLTLPARERTLAEWVGLSVRSFGGKIRSPDEGKYLFVLEKDRTVVGCSLIIARHGTRESPHLFFEVDPEEKTLELRAETEGRTELGGLILDPAFRGHPEKLGKRLSYVRLLYMGRHPARFLERIIAELLPPFTPEGKSPLWEALGRRFTGLDYREADERAKKDKTFVAAKFPRGKIQIDSLPPGARTVIGVPGPETVPVARMLEEAGFRYLKQIDPFDGGPHYGARQGEVRWSLVEDFLLNRTEVGLEAPLCPTPC